MKDKIIKVVYFDESSAVDYINIIDGGKLENQVSSTNENGMNGKLSIGAKIASNLKFLNFLNAETNVETKAELVSQSKDIVKSTITNTILTDFITKVSEEETMIKMFDHVEVTILKDSFTYMKLYTPYTYIISDKSEINKDIAVNKLDDIMEKIKGYYEILAKDEKKEYVLRFNINCFRNNYKLTDLLKMNLTYYGIKVGKTTKNKLAAVNELNMDNSLKEINAEEIVGKALNKDLQRQDIDTIDIYDIILAGVKNNDE